MNQSYYESVRNQFDRLRKALQEDGRIKKVGIAIAKRCCRFN